MSNGLINFALGKNFTISAQTVAPDNTTGIFANVGSAMTFNGRLVAHGNGLELTKDNISPTDCPDGSGVVTEKVTKFSIQELENLTVLANAGSPRLEQLVLAGFYVRFIIDKYDNSNAARSGATGLLRRMIAYVCFDNWNEDVPKERVVASAAFETIGVADGAGGWKANPYFTSSNAVTDIP